MNQDSASRPPMTILRALCIAKTLKGDGELGDALRLLADTHTRNTSECICPKCGVRHGGTRVEGEHPF